jgi:hypothetical protein
MKAKKNPPVLDFEHTEDDQEPFKCIVTLAPLRDDEGGFDACKFEHTGRTKKAAKGKAMEKALTFLQTQPIYKRVVTVKDQLKVCATYLSHTLAPVQIYSLQHASNASTSTLYQALPCCEI